MYSVWINDFIGIFSLQQVETAMDENFVDIDSRIHMQARSAHVHMCVLTCNIYHSHIKQKINLPQEMKPLLILAISHLGHVLYLCGMTQASLSVTLR